MYHALGFAAWISPSPAESGGYEIHMDVHVHEDGADPVWPYMISAFADVPLGSTSAEVTSLCTAAIRAEALAQLELDVPLANILVLAWLAGT